jgi:hypothetical protein
LSYDTIVAERPVARPAATGTNGMAIASFVLGLLWLGGLGSLLAVVFGAIGRKQVRESGQGGNGLAVAGLVLGIIGLVGALFWIVAIAMAANDASTAIDAYERCINTAADITSC